MANVKFLGAHVKSLRDELDKDPSVAKILFREGFSTACGRSLGALFVQPRLALVLRSYELKFDPPEPREFEHQMREQEAGRLANDLRDLAYLIQSFKVKDGDSADVVAYDVLKFANDIHGAWISGFNDTVLHGISRRRSEKRAGLRRRSTWERHPTCENYQRSYLTGVRRSSRNFENISLHLMNSTEQSSPTRFILSNRRSCRIST